MFHFQCYSSLPHQNMSEILHIIMEPSLAMISHIVQDSFDFKNRLDKDFPNGSTLSTCDTKSFYTIIEHDLFYTAVEYWTEKLQNDLALLRRFSKQFIFEGLSITLGFSFFYINGIYIHQINSNKAGLFESSFFWVRVNLTSPFISKEEIT